MAPLRPIDTPADASGIHLADITREAYIYFGAGATVLWQMANPGVGHGVADHSRTLERPLDRLRATMTYVYAVTLGTEAERKAIGKMVDRAHAPVRAPTYSAFDRDLQLWVAATLYRGAVDLYELFVGPVPPDSRERLYRESWAYGSTLQVRDEQWPATVAEFDRWWEARRTGLRVDEPVRRYMHAVLGGGRAPWFTRLAMPLQRFVTRGLVPDDLRRAYHLPWSNRDERNWRRFKRWAPRIYWALPGFVRHLPAKFYLRDMRRRLARQSAG